ncbi:MAG: hydantoinase/oxoprolinase family protein, partial [Alphaproteobacteria bacterium]|nr:hydantoinase/oxoprolinase family protein [Alphaproteobacteria bacterium]
METAAVDVGSSFTDVIRRDASGRLTFAKLPSESADPAAPVLAAAGAGALRHGTTLGLNALLQRKGARVGLIVTKGFRDVLNLGRQSRRELYAMPPRAATPDFLVAETLRAEIDERIDAEGRVVTPLDDAEAARVIRRLVADGAEALAIGLLFAFRNPIHEHRLAAIAAGMFPGLPVSESHEVDPLPREFERIAATACDAFLRPTMGGYLRRLARPDLHVMRSSGGLIDGAEAARQPARLLLSGPAAAALRAAEAARAAGCPDALSID